MDRAAFVANLRVMWSTAPWPVVARAYHDRLALLDHPLADDADVVLTDGDDDDDDVLDTGSSDDEDVLDTGSSDDSDASSPPSSPLFRLPDCAPPPT
jgi:hypothetical protein